MHSDLFTGEDVCVVERVFSFTIIATGQVVTVAGEKASIDALVDVIKTRCLDVVKEGVVADVSFEPGHLVSSDGHIIEGFDLPAEVITFPKIPRPELEKSYSTKCDNISSKGYGPTRFTHSMGGPVVHQFSSIGADRALCGFLPRGPYTPVETDITCPGCIEPHLYCLDHAPMGWPRTLKTDCRSCHKGES